jgi:hypothetical protein
MATAKPITDVRTLLAQVARRERSRNLCKHDVIPVGQSSGICSVCGAIVMQRKPLLGGHTHDR